MLASASAFAPSVPKTATHLPSGRVHITSKASTLTMSAATAKPAPSGVDADVAKLKKVLEREYISFFDPMEISWYSPSVTFDDPMTTLEGVDQYRKNVDMLASRTLMGKFLFDDASINLHSVTGGETDGTIISDIQTRWTLKVTASVLPWEPTARFTGISVYKLAPGGANGVEIIGQLDYWDSVNLKDDGSGQYQTVAKWTAVQDFIAQLKPGGPKAQAAAPELPYELLRRGDGYEVRRYPAFSGVRLPYKRRDEGFGSLGAFSRSLSPLSPALMEVKTENDTSDKYMMWPLAYAMPGQAEAAMPKEAEEMAGEGQWRTIRTVQTPARVVAVRGFTDASMGPVVKNADRELREILERDGLQADPVSGEEGLVRFAQYDAIFSMGERRGEVWIDLADRGHPW